MAELQKQQDKSAASVLQGGVRKYVVKKKLPKLYRDYDMQESARLLAESMAAQIEEEDRSISFLQAGVRAYKARKESPERHREYARNHFPPNLRSDRPPSPRERSKSGGNARRLLQRSKANVYQAIRPQKESNIVAQQTRSPKTDNLGESNTDAALKKEPTMPEDAPVVKNGIEGEDLDVFDIDGNLRRREQSALRLQAFCKGYETREHVDHVKAMDSLGLVGLEGSVV